MSETGLSIVHGKTNRTATMPQRSTLIHLGAFFKRSRSSNTADVPRQRKKRRFFRHEKDKAPSISVPFCSAPHSLKQSEQYQYGCAARPARQMDNGTP